MNNREGIARYAKSILIFLVVFSVHGMSPALEAQAPPESPPERPEPPEVFYSSQESDAVVEAPPTPPAKAAESPPVILSIPDREMLPFEIQDVFFEPENSEFGNEAVASLNTLAQALPQDSRAIAIVLEGHTDSTENNGDELKNFELGSNRAKNVKEYLVDLGVKPDRLQTLSYGHFKPFCMESSKECLKENRRVHIFLR